MNKELNLTGKSDKVLVLDFDHTCYDTDTFILNEIRQPMIDHFNIPIDKWEESYRAAADIGYSTEEHFEQLGKIMKPLPCSLEEILDFAKSMRFDKYLFRDTMPFLKEAREKGYKIMILSFGTVAWQNKKVLGVGLDKLVDDIEYVIADENKSKADMIGKYARGASRVIFVDNKGSNLDQVVMALPHVETYLINRVPQVAMDFGDDDQVRIKYLESRAIAQTQSLPIHKRCQEFSEITL